MADIVKTNLRKIKQEIEVGSRVCVDDRSLDMNQRYSYYLPVSSNKLLGIVVAVFSGNRFQVKWDVDDTVNIVNSSNLTLEREQPIVTDSNIKSSNTSDAANQDATSTRSRTKWKQNMKLPVTDVTSELDSSTSNVSFEISAITPEIHTSKGASIESNFMFTKTRKTKSLNPKYSIDPMQIKKKRLEEATANISKNSKLFEKLRV